MTCHTCSKRWVSNGLWYCRKREIKPYPVLGTDKEIRIIKACRDYKK